MESFCILVPIYNEEENIDILYKELRKFISEAPILTQVILINDGSTDTSKELINNVCNKDKNFSALHLDKNYGLSTALKAGIDRAQTTYVGYIDADLQTHPEDFHRLLKYRNEYEMVIGVRENRGDGFMRILSSKIGNGIRRIFTKDGVHDTNCPLKIIRTENAKLLPVFNGMHRFFPALIQLQDNAKVKQVLVSHYPRIAGESKFGVKNRLFTTLIDCFAFVWIKRRYIQYRIEETL